MIISSVPEADPPADPHVPTLAELTTLRVGGPAGRYVEATTTEELITEVAAADAGDEPVLLVGGGSNLLVADAGFDGAVIKIATSGVTAEVDTCSGATVTVAAGENWDHLVADTVAQGWSGLEALSGIPGLVGATPQQNVGAYGAEIADVVARVQTYDRHARTLRTFSAAECRFGYRDSLFKQAPGRYLITAVTLQLPLGALSSPIRYAELARWLGVAEGARVPATELRSAVLALRRGKGMVLDEVDHDTWSAGSFFTNPILPCDLATALPPQAPRFAAAGGQVKTSAAWLIDQAGFAKGYGDGPARLSTKHVLAITNRGGATAGDVVDLARRVRDGVAERFGVILVPEPHLVGCSI